MQERPENIAGPPDVSAVVAAVNAGDLSRATELSLEMLRQGAEHPLLLNLRAYWLERQERDSEALADLQRAAELAPRDLPVLNALGLCLLKLDRPGEALDVLNRAIAAEPGFAPAYINRAMANDALGEVDAAQADFLRALEIAPSNIEAAARLAALSARSGNWPMAREQATRALAQNPRHPDATISLAQAELADGRPDAAAARISALLQFGDLPSISRATAQSVLADIYDAQSRYSEAFAAYRAANDGFRAIYAPRFESPDVETMPAYVGRLTDYFVRSGTWNPAPATASMLPGDSAGHAFLVGFPRSGTTLLERVLANNDRIATIEERPTISAQMTRKYLAGPESLDRLAALGESDAEALRAGYWQYVRQSGYPLAGKIVLDKYPLNSIKLPLIAKLFPEAGILFALRDPRDVVLSCFRRRFRINPSMFEFLDLQRAARFYDQVMRLCDTYFGKLQMKMRFCRYEDMIADFDRETEATCRFIGASWTEDMRGFAQRAGARTSATPSSAQVARALYSGEGQWRRYAREMDAVKPILAPWVEHFGYPSW